MNPSGGISIALCTFNGERFLDEQLRSILDQSRQADELVVFDDGSTDGTNSILQSFAASSPSFPVRIHFNENRLGPAANFAAAIAACKCDIISLCDQDDIWEPEKIEKTLAAFSRNPRPAFVFSEAEMIDSAGRSLGYRLWQSVGFTADLQRQFDNNQALDVLLRQNVVTGATLSFDAKYRSLLLPIAPGWMHDGWIALLLSAVAGAVAIDEPLIRYRQHAAQSLGAERRSLYQQYLNAKAMDGTVFATQATDFSDALERLQESSDVDVSHQVVRQLQEKIEFARTRSGIRLRETGRVLPALRGMLSGRYSRYALGWKSFAQDLFL